MIDKLLYLMFIGIVLWVIALSGEVKDIQKSVRDLKAQAAGLTISEHKY